MALYPVRALGWFAIALGALALAACEPDKPDQAAVATVLVPGQPPPPPPARPYDPGNYKVGKAYQVGDQWYYPKVDPVYEERGVASWYGPNFHGKKTANGEIFDMTLISAAHTTLPMPSVVRVTNLENGRSLLVRINDRGPFVRGRIIDLSRRAAELLGFTSKGTAMVHVRLLLPESRRAALAAGATGAEMAAYGPTAPKASPSIPVSVEALAPADGVAAEALPPAPAVAAAPPLPPQPSQTQGSTPPPFGGMTAIHGEPGGVVVQPASAPTRDEAEAPIDVAELPRRDKVDHYLVAGRPNIFIQAGAFRSYINANKLRARLTGLGHPVNVSQVQVATGPFFRVRLGPLNSVQDADQALERVVALGYPEARIVVD